MLQISSTRYCTPVQNFKPIAILYDILMAAGQQLQTATTAQSQTLETVAEENLEVEEIPSS